MEALRLTTIARQPAIDAQYVSQLSAGLTAQQDLLAAQLAGISNRFNGMLSTIGSYQALGNGSE